MKGWEIKSLGDVCHFQGGSQPPKAVFSTVCKEGYIRLIQIRDYKSDKHIVYIPKDKARRFCSKSDVMIGRYGPPVFQILRGLEGAYNVALMKATPDESQLIKEYLFYFLKSPKIQQYIINLSARAAGQSGLNKATIEPYPIPVPPIAEQKRIVAVLNEAFEGIDSAIDNTERNLANARELFESYLNQKLLSVASSAPTQILSCITELIVDCEHKTAPTQETGFPSIRTPNIEKGYLNFDNVNRVSEETYELWTRRAKPKAGDLILAREAPAGNVGVIPDGQTVCLGQRTVLIRLKSEVADPQYLAFLLLHRIMQSRLLEHSTGATVQHVNMKDIRKLAISDLPPLPDQVAYVQELEEAKLQTARLEAIYQQKIAALNELKQSILQKAFSGELTTDTAAQASNIVQEVAAA